MNMKGLKIIGLLAMTLDHIGVWLVPGGTWNLVLRCIGRLAFPLFAFMIAEGFSHTRNLRKYWFRLLFASLAVELCLFGYFLATGENWMWQNDIFLSLFLGLSALILAKSESRWLRLLVLPLLAIAQILGVSYGAFGILFILVFGLLPSRLLQLAGTLFLLSAFVEYPFYFLTGIPSPFTSRIYGQWFEWFALLAFVPLFLYDGKRGSFSKWFFYAYYPAHLGLIVLLGEILR